MHASDATNASRTMLYDIAAGRWDPKLMNRLAIPETMLPDVCDCQAMFGTCSEEHFGAELPILGVAGDQQAASFGQACFEPGMIKATFGTGCFVLVNTGSEKVRSRSRMLTTVGWQLQGKAAFALEGSIFMAGATVQWLRDSLGLFREAGETEAMAARADASSGCLSGSCVPGPRRAILGCAGPRRHRWADPGSRRRRDRPRRAGERCLPDGRSACGHRRRHGNVGPETADCFTGRWRHDGQCMVDAVPRRYCEPAVSRLPASPRRQRSAPPIMRACRLAYSDRQMRSERLGRRQPVSSRR